VDHIIPGNDDAIRAIRLYVTAVADAIAEGQSRAAGNVRADEFVEVEEMPEPAPAPPAAAAPAAAAEAAAPEAAAPQAAAPEGAPADEPAAASEPEAEPQPEAKE